ncbi:MAG: SDR family oxidoreductase [Eubacterium sp.]|nr:SDR family oxidoreductase [Eubacterium sp.]
MPIACITGASSGIGKEFARQYAAKGFDLILIARNREAMERIAEEVSVAVEIIVCDLSNELKTMELAEKLKQKKIDVFINNAGFGDVGDFETTDIYKDLDMINVNIKAMHILLKKLLPQFLKRDKGYILNVASSAGMMPGGPYMATYYATKAYVVSMTGAVYDELKRRKSHVRISALCPGPVDTNFNDVAGVKFSLAGISAEECVSYAIKMLARGKLMIVPTLTMKAAVIGSKLIPRTLALHMTAGQQKKKIQD